MGNVNKEDIMMRLNKNRVQPYDNNKELEVYDSDPLSLIDYRRFDIMAKYIYGWFRAHKLNSDWGERLYEDHIWVFNRYDEDDGSGKKGIHSFLKSFNSTLYSIEQGFDESVSLLPLGKNQVPLDGAHRLAAALLYKKQVKVVNLSDKDINYNYEFFKKKGLLTKWSDAMAYQYCRLKRNTYVVILFPMETEKMNEAKEIIEKFGDVYYQKDVQLEKNGPKNLIFKLFKDDKLVPLYFQNIGPIRVFVLETNELEDLVKVKEEIKEKLKNQYSIYINDDHKDTIELTQIFFNGNSIHFFNNTLLGNNKALDKKVDVFRGIISSQVNEKENYCIVFGSVLEVYGISKSTEEIGFIHFDINYTSSNHNCLDGFVNHNKDLINQTKTITDIIFNPENHFYYNGLKFASLKLTSQMLKGYGKPLDKETTRTIKNLIGTWPNHLDRELLFYNIMKKITIVRLDIAAAKFKVKKLLKGLQRKFKIHLSSEVKR